MVSKRLGVKIEGARALREATGPADSPNTYCVCEILGKPRINITTQVINSTCDPVWEHTAELGDFLEADSLLFSIWEKDGLLGMGDALLGQASLSGAQALAGFEGELLLSGGAGDGAGAYVKVKVEPPPPGCPAAPRRGASPEPPSPGRARAAGRRSSEEAHGGGSLPRGRRAASEPPPGSVRAGRPTEKVCGPERFFYDRHSYTGTARFGAGGPRGASAGGPGGGAPEGAGPGGAAPQPAALPRCAPGRGSSFPRAGRAASEPPPGSTRCGGPTRRERGPERFFYETGRYTGTHQHGGPSTTETGPLQEVLVAGFAGASAAGNGKYRRHGELGGRSCFAKLDGGAFLYCLARRTWCIAPHLGAATRDAWATMEDGTASPPVGAWRVNGAASASGQPRVEAASHLRIAELEQVTRPSLRHGSTFCASSAHTHSRRMPCAMVDKASSMPRPASATQGACQHYEELTIAAKYRRGVLSYDFDGIGRSVPEADCPPLGGLPRPGLRPCISPSSTGSSKCSGRQVTRHHSCGPPPGAQVGSAAKSLPSPGGAATVYLPPVRLPLQFPHGCDDYQEAVPPCGSGLLHCRAEVRPLPRSRKLSDARARTLRLVVS